MSCSDVLAGRLSQSGTGGAGEIADFLLLQLLNRAEPLFAHLATATGLHPETLYRAMLELAGELATFTQPGKRAASYPVYRHDHLGDTFAPLIPCEEASAIEDRGYHSSWAEL